MWASTGRTKRPRPLLFPSSFRQAGLKSRFHPVGTLNLSGAIGAGTQKYYRDHVMVGALDRPDQLGCPISPAAFRVGCRGACYCRRYLSLSSSFLHSYPTITVQSGQRHRMHLGTDAPSCTISYPPAFTAGEALGCVAGAKKRHGNCRDLSTRKYVLWCTSRTMLSLVENLSATNEGRSHLLGRVL